MTRPRMPGEGKARPLRVPPLPALAIVLGCLVVGFAMGTAWAEWITK